MAAVVDGSAAAVVLPLEALVFVWSMLVVLKMSGQFAHALLHVHVAGC